MVERVESVVVGEHDVRVVVEEEGQHVVPLLGDGVMQRCVTLAVLIMTTSQLVHIQNFFLRLHMIYQPNNRGRVLLRPNIKLY